MRVTLSFLTQRCNLAATLQLNLDIVWINPTQHHRLNEVQVERSLDLTLKVDQVLGTRTVFLSHHLNKIASLWLPLN